ncbi:MAG: HNH/ENDO VII family nuclease [Planctomycetaceae bacterium]|jgi:hypothetical protein|nr:HNH/ENDO VII family nuclease [Planctomycetaceae bacterium]
MKKFSMSIVLVVVLCGSVAFAQTDNPYKRYPLSQETRQQIWDNAIEPNTGQVRDPLTGKFISPKGNWDAGHKPGYEHSKHVQSAFDRALTDKEFKAEHNNPSYYRPELPSSNRSHKLEAPKDVNNFPQASKEMNNFPQASKEVNNLPQATYWQTFKKNAKPILKFMSKIL